MKRIGRTRRRLPAPPAAAVKRGICLLAACVALLTAPACQKTPDAPVVLQKDMAQMIEIGLAPAAETGKPAGRQNAANRLGAPTRYTWEWVSPKGKLRVSADADVILPDTDSVPMVKVRRRHFTLEEAAIYANVLFGEHAAYIDPYDAELPRAVHERSIRELQQMLADGDFLDKYNSEGEVREALQELTRYAADAPETAETVAPSFAWREDFPQKGSRLLTLRAMPDTETLSAFRITEYDADGQNRLIYHRDLHLNTSTVTAHIGPNDAAASRLLRTTPEEAYALACGTVERMQIADLVCTGRMQHVYESGTRAAYDFLFTRAVNGVPVTLTEDDGSGMAPGSVILPWRYERLRILIDDEGVLFLQYDAPYALVETMAESTNMLPFAEIQNVFEKMIPLLMQDAFMDESGEIGGTFTWDIREVRLGLMRITERDIPDLGILVPVWDFMGATTVQWADGATEERRESYASMMTVNAVDGTVVDRKLGY